MASAENVEIIYLEAPSTGAALGLASIGFSIVAILTPLATVSLPLAVLLMMAAFVRGLWIFSLLGMATGILAGLFVVIGYATSPLALALHLAFLGVLAGGAHP
jgi:hypothetical protein